MGGTGSAALGREDPHGPAEPMKREAVNWRPLVWAHGADGIPVQSRQRPVADQKVVGPGLTNVLEAPDHHVSANYMPSA